MPTSVTVSSGSLLIVAAPSGAGKSSLVNALLEQDPEIRLSISSTTRPPRPGEQDGREYHFLSVEEFRDRQARGEFLESAEVHGNFYGTSQRWIAEQLAAGTDVLLEIDWQGARQVRRIFTDAIGIFILPPSLQILEERLRKRGQDAPEVIARRLQAASSEMAHAPEFDYVIINQDFADALRELAGIVNTARLRFGSQAIRHAGLFEHLGIARTAPAKPNR